MAQSKFNTPLIGSVFERKPGTPSTFRPKTSDSEKTGFPSAKHRSKSAFARARNVEKLGGQERPREPPSITAIPPKQSSDDQSPADDWRHQVEEENMRRVENMSPEELEQERKEILDRFGSNLGDILKKARAARETKEVGDSSRKPIEVITTLGSSEHGKIHQPSPLKTPRKSALVSRPSSPLSASSTRPPSRQLRFADLTPQDVHVYESAPPSPKRKPLALPPPTDNDGPTISLGEFRDHFKLPAVTSPQHTRTEQNAKTDEVSTEEGTPEDIRRRFFPAANANDPSLAWMKGSESSQPEAGPSNPSLRFDLTGTPIPLSLTSTLPTHLGLHHHAEGTHAGYTLDDLFLLSRSTVPGQRASMLDVLRRIAKRLGDGVKHPSKGIPELVGQEEGLRKRILAAGVEAMAERGSLGAQAVAAIWQCLVGWDEGLGAVEGVELKQSSDDDIVSSLPLEYVLPQIASAIVAIALPTESLSQLLAVVHRLAQHTNDIANNIVETPNLVVNIIQTFLLTPIPPPDASSYPEPFALQTLTILAHASRSNASTLAGPADALLRFVVTLPNSSPFPPLLATTLLTSTLRFYTALASYGFYAQIATTAYEQFHKLSRYALSEECHSSQLREAWLGLLEAWMVCARDPHRTSPPHEILWSQVVGWGWNDDVLELRQRLSVDNASVWAALWRAAAAWLEGASVNGVRGGETEKAAVIDAVIEGFTNGQERSVVEASIKELKRLLQGWTALSPTDLPLLQAIARHGSVVASAIRFWLSCLPSSSQTGLESPPFRLPFNDISNLSALVATHSIWQDVLRSGTEGLAYAPLRPLSSFLTSYLSLSKVMPGTSDDFWMAQAFTILMRLLPGDNDAAIRIIQDVVGGITQPFMTSHGLVVPPVIWEKRGMDPIVPFLTYSLRVKDVTIGSYWSTPKSISMATTLRLPPASRINPESRKDISLPLPRDWLFAPLDYLLRSGQTDIFKTLPSWWNFSETEVVRATLLLVRVQREVLLRNGLFIPMLSREETVFGCMKVFMLEHEQQQESSSEEVFRDSIVGDFMRALIAPFTISVNHSAEVIVRSLHPYPGNFVSLYDSVSFSHPLFAQLLLPPTSMRYPVDYRKYLWVDYGHVLKTIRTPITEAVAESIDEYLYPVETNSEILSAYLRGLAKNKLEGLVRLVAIHHIACNIWADLRTDQESSVGDKEKSAKLLLQGVVTQGDFDTVKEVVLYKQSREINLILPPACFEQDGDWKAPRRAFVAQCEDIVIGRLKNLL
ncbi:hypothetical protein QCA50_006598 [Cerrena zonata]|uniref:RNA polymerase II-associated protein 1 C-terminal domain-containing protein n=1 Tax=Cerrena zonata TaxID=2478898 RepID=A0AAW0GI97_9APHY